MNETVKPDGTVAYPVDILLQWSDPFEGRKQVLLIPRTFRGRAFIRSWTVPVPFADGSVEVDESHIEDYIREMRQEGLRIMKVSDLA